jgi:hypothetical protein
VTLTLQRFPVFFVTLMEVILVITSYSRKIQKGLTILSVNEIKEKERTRQNARVLAAESTKNIVFWYVRLSSKRKFSTFRRNHLQPSLL